MKRLFKFIGVFVLTAAIIFSIIFLPNWNTFKTFFENREAMAEGSEWVDRTYSLAGLSQFIDEKPGHVSIASLVKGHPDSTILFMEDVPRTMGTVSNFFLLVAAADLIDKGVLDTDQMIKRSDISKYQLPDVYENVHRETFSNAISRGWIDDGVLKLKHALELLAEFNDLALADYVWWLIGEEYWNNFKERLNLAYTDLPLPFSGLYLATAPGIQNESQQELISKYSADRAGFEEFVISESGSFNDYDAFRESVIEKLKRNRLGSTFMEERDALAVFPKTTTSEMTSILMNLVNKELISPEADEQILEWMRWPMKRQRPMTRNFTDYGAIFDNRMGLLNGIDFGTSEYTGDTTVQAVFFDKLPIGFWFHMSSNHMHQDFQQRLIFDPAMIERMKMIAGRHSERDLVDE